MFAPTMPSAPWLACLPRPEATLKDGFACYLIGLVYVNRGNDAAALPFYSQATARNLRHAEALEARARLLHRQGRFNEAIEDYDALFRFRPENAEALCNLGGAYEGAQLRPRRGSATSAHLNTRPAMRPR